MFLDREWTGVESDTKDFDIGEDAGPETAKGEGKQLSYNLDMDAQISMSDCVRSPQ